MTKALLMLEGAKLNIDWKWCFGEY